MSNIRKAMCPKCGLIGQYGVQFAITYCKGTKAKPEHMSCECDRCGYTWARQPEDYETKREKT